MGVGALAEPLVVIVLLFGGTWVNRNKTYTLFGSRQSRWREKLLEEERDRSPDSVQSPHSADGLLEDGLFPSSLGHHEPTWRRREVNACGFRVIMISPNTRVFKDYFLSRLLLKFPFLVEAWYWALIYWVSCSQARDCCGQH